MKFIILALLLIASSQVRAADALSLLGAGATFPAPFYQKCFTEYKIENPNVEITYNPIGSGGGIKNLKEQTVDFGASDAPMTDEEMKDTKEVLHIPTVLGAVVVTQNLGQGNVDLKFTPDVLASIFLGEITKWNDPKIVELNKSEKLPDLDIIVVYRADSSGTTNIFTEYLSKVSSTWKTKVGAGKSVKWLVGQGNKGNQGVASVVKNTPGAIGYVELVFAEQEAMAIDQIKNKAGQFVRPSLASVTAAADATAKSMPADFRVSLTNAEGKNSYPISAYTYILVYKQMGPSKGKEIVKLLNWMTEKGQTFAQPLFYAPLPAAMLAKVKAKIKTIQLK